MKRGAAALVFAIVLSGCAYTARTKCESMYADRPGADLTPCIEQQIEWKRSVAGYFGQLSLSLVQLAASLI